jgi:hypothetical protein
VKAGFVLSHLIKDSSGIFIVVSFSCLQGV